MNSNKPWIAICAATFALGAFTMLAVKPADAQGVQATSTTQSTSSLIARLKAVPDPKYAGMVLTERSTVDHVVVDDDYIYVITDDETITKYEKNGLQKVYSNSLGNSRTYKVNDEGVPVPYKPTKTSKD